MPTAPRMNKPQGGYDFWADTLQPGLFGLYDRWTEQKPWPTPAQIDAAVQNPGLLDRDVMAGYAVDMAQPFAAKLGGLLAHGAMPTGGLFGITTWHGSPHKWTKPDISKVGTGEGAQAYGHGFYSAERKKTADWYRKNLSPDATLTKDGEKAFQSYLDDWAKSKVSAWDDMSRLQADLSSAQKRLDATSGSNITDDDLLAFILEGKDFPLDPNAATREALQNEIEQIQLKMGAIRAANPRINDPKLDVLHDFRTHWGQQQWFDFVDQADASLFDKGHLYKLDIPDEDVARYLDWDKPLSEQGEDIRNLAKAVGLPEEIDDHGLLGRALYEHIAQSNIKGFKPSQDIASEMLLDAGIPGIRYLDGSSRSAGEGTYNYVTFDPSRIKVLERNGEDLQGLLGR